MRAPTFRFRPLRGRSYGYRSTATPPTVDPRNDGGIRRPLPYRGGGAASEPPSRNIIDRDAISPGRSFLGNTEAGLQSGPAPDRINRNTTARNAGIIGPDRQQGWPYDGNALFLPHNPIPRTPITVTPFARTIDTGVTIPSVQIGAPVG